MPAQRTTACRSTPAGSPAAGVLAHRRPSPRGALLALHSFVEEWRNVPRDWAEAMGATRFHDALGEGDVATPDGTIALPPYARLWLL